MGRWGRSGCSVGVVGKGGPAVLFSSLVAAIVARSGVAGPQRPTLGVAGSVHRLGFQPGQIGSASLVSLRTARTTPRRRWASRWPDRVGDWTDTKAILFWVALRRVGDRAGHLAGWLADHRMLGKGVVDIAPVKGMAAQNRPPRRSWPPAVSGFAIHHSVATGFGRPAQACPASVARSAGGVRGPHGRRLADHPPAGFTAAVMVWIAFFGNGVLGAVIAAAILIVSPTGHVVPFPAQRGRAPQRQRRLGAWHQDRYPSATDNVSVGWLAETRPPSTSAAHPHRRLEGPRRRPGPRADCPSSTGSACAPSSASAPPQPPTAPPPKPTPPARGSSSPSAWPSSLIGVALGLSFIIATGLATEQIFPRHPPAIEPGEVRTTAMLPVRRHRRCGWWPGSAPGCRRASPAPSMAHSQRSPKEPLRHRPGRRNSMARGV